MNRYVGACVCVYDPECSKTRDDGELTHKMDTSFSAHHLLGCLVPTRSTLSSLIERKVKHKFVLPQTLHADSLKRNKIPF